MDSQRLSRLLDTMIDDILAQRKRRLQTRRQVMGVVLSGEDLSTLPATLDCLTALNRSGYLLTMAFSHSARQSSLQAACLDGLAQRDVEVLCCQQEPQQAGEFCSGLYLPALSTNSLSKIALGIRDNLVCRWVFHALSRNKPVMVTLNAECRPDAGNSLPQAFRARLANYAATLAQYGITVIPSQTAGAKHAPSASINKRLITLRDVRQYQRGEALHIGDRTLITPAARDDMRDRGIVIIQDPTEEACFWQR
ncbi:flavoprotein [Acerihabitans sp. KWT182]|uniref:Flavoprotein n=1 Tax=Acerihabitans sp. KWT182 TaxID=3157919 RepID=A0AAU7QCV4_9GAMM